MKEEEIMEALNPINFVGRAPQQTEEFIAECVQPLLAQCDDLDMDVELTV